MGKIPYAGYEPRRNVGDVDRRLVIIAEYEQGMKVAEIATRYGVHRTYPSVLARRKGIPVRKDWKRTPRKPVA